MRIRGALLALFAAAAVAQVLGVLLAARRLALPAGAVALAAGAVALAALTGYAASAGRPRRRLDRSG
jgi:hypothetical protein